MLFRSESKKLIAELRNQLDFRAAQLSFQYAQFHPLIIHSLVNQKPRIPDIAKKNESFVKQMLTASFDDVWPLDKEVQVMRLFLELMVARKELLTPIFHSTGLDDGPFLDIKALSLFPLVQNAVLYGFESPQASPIKISLTQHPHSLRLEVSNTVNPYLTNQAETPVFSAFHQGLNYLYPHRTELIWNSNSNRSKATLTIFQREKK